VHRKLVLDREYIQRAGLLLDVRLFSCTGLRMLKVPERWLLPIFGLRRDVTLGAVPAALPGNGSGNGADTASHAAATPASILVEAAGNASPGDGSHPSRHKHTGKRSHDGNRPPKPK